MPNTERYRFNQQIKRFRLDKSEEMIHCQVTGASKILPGSDLRLLQECNKFAALDEHATNICQNLSVNVTQRPAVLSFLQKSALEGLLLSESNLLDIARRSAGAIETAKITSVTVPTKNRSDQLKRSLESYAESFQKFDRAVKLIVADQSDPSVCQTNAENLAEISGTFGIEIEHIDQESVARFCTQLADHIDLPHLLLQFALANESTGTTKAGCSRNLLLLLTVGELTAQVDDDTMCRVVPSPDATGGLSLTSHPGVEHWFPGPDVNIGLDPDLQMADVLGLHEQLLGKSISECVSQLSPSEVNIDKAASEFFRKLKSCGGRLVSTSLGLAGQSCRSPWQPFIFTDEPSRTRLTKSEAIYNYIQHSHQILQGVRTATICDSSSTGSMNLGLDNREILPPFMPIMRGQDMVFAKLLPKTLCGGYFGKLPWLLFHEGGQRKDYEGVKGSAQISFPTILTALLSSYKPGIEGQSTEQHFLRLGAWLSDFGSMPLGEFNEVLRSELYKVECARIASLEVGLATHKNLPKFWADDIRELMSASRQNLLDKDFVVARNVIESYGIETAAKVQQELICKLGELLYAWPEIRRGAVDLRHRGVAVGTTVSKTVQVGGKG